MNRTRVSEIVTERKNRHHGNRKEYDEIAASLPHVFVLAHLRPPSFPFLQISIELDICFPIFDPVADELHNEARYGAIACLRHCLKISMQIFREPQTLSCAS